MGDKKALVEWFATGTRNGWYMPEAPHWFWRLPVIRHLWLVREAMRVEHHYTYGLGSIGFRTGYDEWVLWGMWRNLWLDDATPTQETRNG